MQKIGWSHVFLVILMALAIRCRADVNPDLVKRGKDATALVEIEGGKGFGSAFCIDSAGFFITNDHVAEALGDKTTLSLVLHPGEKEQKKLTAKVVRVDHEADLALLQVDSKEKLTALELGDSDSLIETADVTVFGYPFGDELAVGKEAYPSVTVSTGHITALRKVNGELAAVQLDGSINPGNSGGPMLNSKGQVVGVIAALLEDAAAINFAVPVNSVHKLLHKTIIALSPLALPSDKIHQEQEFTIRLLSLQKPQMASVVELILSANAQDHRAFTATSLDGVTFHVRAIAIPVQEHSRGLQLTIQEGQNKITCAVEDRDILIGSRKVRLSQIQQIERQEKTQVTLKDGQTLTGSLSGLEKVQTEIAGAEATLNLDKAESVFVQETALPDSIACEVRVRRAGKVTDTLTTQIAVASSTAKPTIARPDLPPTVELLVASYDTHSVKRFNGQTGAFMDDFAYGNGINGANGITIGPDGNLYVACGGSSTVHRFNGQTGQFLSIFIPSVDGEPTGAASAIFGSDGNLYVSSVWTNKIRRYNGKTGAYIDDFVPKELGGLSHPGFLKFGPDGNLYVASGMLIKRYNGKTGAFMNDFAGMNGIQSATDFIFGPDGSLYVCSAETDEIKRFDAKTGAYLGNFVKAASGGLKNPCGLAFGPDGNLYVAASSLNMIKRYNGKTGEYIDDFAPGGAMNGPKQLFFRKSVRYNK